MSCFAPIPSLLPEFARHSENNNKEPPTFNRRLGRAALSAFLLYFAYARLTADVVSIMRVAAKTGNGHLPVNHLRIP